MEQNNDALKNEEITLDDNEQVTESNEKQGIDSLEDSEIVQEDDIESIKTENEKLKKERDNYRKATLKYKKKSKNVEDDSVEQAAEKAVKKTLHKQNETQAINEFLDKNPEYNDVDLRKDLFANYQNKSGQNDVESIIKDLERASVVTKFDKGDNVKQKNNPNSKLSSLQTVSGIGMKKSRVEKSNVSEGAIKMAEKLRVDPKKLEEIDDTNYMEIQF